MSQSGIFQGSLANHQMLSAGTASSAPAKAPVQMALFPEGAFTFTVHKAENGYVIEVFESSEYPPGVRARRLSMHVVSQGESIGDQVNAIMVAAKFKV